MNKNIYYDLKGYINLQVVGAEDKDIQMINKQLGVIGDNRKSKHVDITFRFVEHLSPDKISFFGFNKFGYTDNYFYLLNPYTGNVEMQIPFDQIGKKCEILCQRGIKNIPLLKEIIKIMFLQKDILSLHASAVEHDQKGIIIIGWAHGGKTSALLAFIQEGAKFVADDWVLYDIENDQVFGFTNVISISDHHVQQMSILASKMDISKRLYMWGIKTTIFFLQQAINVTHRKPRQKYLFKLKNKLQVNLHPNKIFRASDIVKQVSLSKIILMVSHNDKSVEERNLTANEFIDFCIQSNDLDLYELYETYQAYCIAFPNKRNLFIEKRHNTEKRLLKKAIRGKQVLRVLHPYPLPFVMFMKKIL